MCVQSSVRSIGYHRSDVLMAECTTWVSCVLARKGRERRESEEERGGERVRKAAAVGSVSCIQVASYIHMHKYITIYLPGHICKLFVLHKHKYIITFWKKKEKKKKKKKNHGRTTESVASASMGIAGLRSMQ